MMKKIIKLFIAVIVLSAIIGIGNAFTSELPTFEDNEEVNKSVEKTKNDEKVEEKSDLSHDYIRQIESEKIANTFSVQTIYDISVALDVSIELLFKND